MPVNQNNTLTHIIQIPPKIGSNFAARVTQIAFNMRRNHIFYSFCRHQ